MASTTRVRTRRYLHAKRPGPEHRERLGHVILCVWGLTRATQPISVLPAGLSKAIAKLNTNGARLYDSMEYKEYAEIDV